MNKEHKKGLVPELRFSEFQNLADWDNEPLKNLYSFKVTNSYSRDQLNYEIGSVKNIHYGDIHTKFSTLFNIENEIVPFINPSISIEKIKLECYCVEGDVIFADASEDLEDVGKSIEIVNLNNDKLLSGLHTLLARQKDEKLIIGFGGYLFKSNRIREQVKKESQGTKVLGISSGRLSNIEVAFPSNKKEQTKIAACLSSLDDLITAQTQKIAALKTHKKGLMQQLFPAEGETVPKLRFPEFRDSGEWEVYKLSELTTKISDGIHTTPIYDENGEYFFINGNNLENGKILLDEKTKKVNLEEFNKHKKPIDSDSILISINGTIGNIAFFKGEKVILGKSACFININSSLVNKFFIYYLLQTNNVKSFFNSELTGSTIKNLSLATIKNIELQIPELSEQQKIAACLSSLDELINAQTKKLNALKLHKKGLMQGLFPVSV